MTKKQSPEQLKKSEETVRRGYEKLTNTKPEPKDLAGLSKQQLRTFYKAGRAPALTSKTKFLIAISILLLVPMAAFSSYGGYQLYRGNNKPLSTSSSTEKSDIQEKSSVPTPAADNKTETTSPGSASGKGTTNNTQPKASPAPTTTTPAPTPAPTPTVLANCFYQNGAKAGQNCPYNPPPSWSTSPLYNCYYGPDHMSGPYAACLSYTNTVSIRQIAYYESGNTPTLFCVFVFNNGTYKRTRVNISSDTENVRCDLANAFTYDPWATN